MLGDWWSSGGGLADDHLSERRLGFHATVCQQWRPTRPGTNLDGRMTKPSKRDDFPISVIRALSERVGTLCSKPDCRAFTKGPHTNPSLASNLGRASHIHAAAAGGPRYDPDQTPDQRRSPDNGIWLCANHAAEIDADPERFPAAELRAWKAAAERHAQEQLGRSMPMTEPPTPSSMMAIGPDVIATGRVLRAQGAQWTLQIESFVLGDLAALRRFSSSFDILPPEDCYFCGEGERIGRMLMEAPVVDSTSGMRVELSLAAPMPRQDAQRIYHVDRLGCDIALDLSGDEPDLDTTFREIEGADLVPQILMTHLSTNKGGWGFGAKAGSRVAEFYHRFKGDRLASFITLEIIRLATVPCLSGVPQIERVPFGFIDRLREVRVLSLPSSSEWFKVALTLDAIGMTPGREFILPISSSIEQLGPRPILRIPA